ncbi:MULTISPECIES: hypothetical protein [unclassified Kribbella]|uniref:hypothetical protein n=1 Tax=unclassified Kribbella TaxID=2644121 RepID=UPI003016A172
MSTTSPFASTSNGAPAAAGTTASTNPTSAGQVARAQAPNALPTVTSGVATQYWTELVPIPSGPMKLWFFVDGNWRALANPTAIQCDMVQRAFLGSGSTTQVWYDGGNVVGLVVSG